MATGNSGTITVTGTKQTTAILYWSETYDVASNTHVVSIDNITFKSSNWYGFTYYLKGTITVDGTVYECYYVELGDPGLPHCVVLLEDWDAELGTSEE